METLEIPNLVKKILKDREGRTLKEKFTRLMLSDLENRLRCCTDRLYEFEKNYGLSFRQFKRDWLEDKILDKYSYGVEADYMEWESLDDEHDLILSQMREIKGKLNS